MVLEIHTSYQCCKRILERNTKHEQLFLLHASTDRENGILFEGKTIFEGIRQSDFGFHMGHILIFGCSRLFLEHISVTI